MHAYIINVVDRDLVKKHYPFNSVAQQLSYGSHECLNAQPSNHKHWPLTADFPQLSELTGFFRN